ncbi:predicted protein [Streptomyces sp. SPB78]|nr:predicted protein [Streptomyces sp. SPB78]
MREGRRGVTSRRPRVTVRTPLRREVRAPLPGEARTPLPRETVEVFGVSGRGCTQGLSPRFTWGLGSRSRRIWRVRMSA